LNLLLPGFKPFDLAEVHSLDWSRVTLVVQLLPGSVNINLSCGISPDDINAYLDFFDKGYLFSRLAKEQSFMGMKVLPIGTEDNTVYDPDHLYFQHIQQRLDLIKLLLWSPDLDLSKVSL
jgi:hypothetical protein